MIIYYYFTFPSTYQALKAEKALSQGPWEFKMVPVPRRISSSCGTALRCRPEDAGRIREIFREHTVEIEGDYEIEEKSSTGPLAFLFNRGGRGGKKDG